MNGGKCTARHGRETVVVMVMMTVVVWVVARVVNLRLHRCAGAQ
jgi:hypothetical protein